MILENLPDVQALSPQDKLLLVEDLLCDLSCEDDPEGLPPLSPDRRASVQERLKKLRDGTDRGMSEEELMDRVNALRWDIG